VPLRRFRWSLITGGTTFQQGLFYATSWQVQYPAGTDFSTVTVTCTDGFGVLSLAHLPALDPASASSLPDVYAADAPYAHYRLGDQDGTKMTAQIGQDGTYSNFSTHGGIRQNIGTPLVTGDPATSLQFIPVTGVNGAIGRGKLDQSNNFGDTNEATIEAVVIYTGSGTQQTIAQGPLNGTVSVHGIGLVCDNLNRISLQVSSATLAITPISPNGSLSLGTPHHVAGTWDGHTGRVYIDGVLVGSQDQGGLTMLPGSAGDYLYVSDTGNDGFIGIQDVAFYEYALPADRIAAHADAALNRGRAAETVGDRIDALVTNALWGTTHISASQLTAEARMFTGQATIDEITSTVAAEQPFGLFYFRDDGDPAYFAWDDTRLVTPAALFGDQGGEIRYTAVGLVYDDEMYNQVLSGRDGGDTFEADDTTSQGAYGVRSYDATGLILATDSDAQRVGQTIIDKFSTPAYRIETVTLNGASLGALTHIIQREVGDYIRIRRRGTGGTPIDIITQILGKQKTFDVNGNLTCTWNLARGFNAATSGWRLGVSGYSELGSTTVLG